ncbi:MAG: hypothetical protein C4542_04190 [Dehalococcoidia bacterium]|nr:MAG: hypothetical protein C4542_04190 [Dehalococcoidia bacterium]
MDITASDISSLDKRLDNLSSADRTLFERLYSLCAQKGEMRIPENMREWVSKQFGSLEAVANQRIVRVTNSITGEESIFNSLRALRPSDTREKTAFSLDSLDMGADSFADPRENTPEDTFGRIEGRYCITASNIAKCDELHGLVIFKNPHPLIWSKEEVADYIDTAWRWAQKAHYLHPLNRYFFFCWNCLWRSGASINHGHAQMMLSRGHAYSHIEALRKAAQSYRRKYGANYFDDLFNVHKALGLAFDRTGVRILACLTPVKNNEIVLMADGLDAHFKKSVYDVLALYRDSLGVTSFNLAIATPPLDRTRESWQGFPVIAWLVDRGSLNYRSCDIGSLELFAANSVSSDPFKLASALRSHFTGEK